MEVRTAPSPGTFHPTSFSVTGNSDRFITSAEIPKRLLSSGLGYPDVKPGVIFILSLTFPLSIHDITVIPAFIVTSN